MENNLGIEFLKTLINLYTRKQKEYHQVCDSSYSGFLDYINVREFLLHLKNLYYKLTNKEYKDYEP